MYLIFNACTVNLLFALELHGFVNPRLALQLLMDFL